MKKRLTMGVAIIALSAFLIAGATIAWFTDTDTFSDAVFTAGTVVVDADSATHVPMENGININNWNPGDCSLVKVDITNEGSKSIVFRLQQFDGVWYENTGTTEEPVWVATTLDNDNVTVGKHESIIYEDSNDTNSTVLYNPAHWHLDGVWLYYIGDPLVAETGTITAYFQVCLKGEETDNDYQGLQFAFGGQVEAIQSSNNAPNEAWGPIEIDPVTGELLYDYLL